MRLSLAPAFVLLSVLLSACSTAGYQSQVAGVSTGFSAARQSFAASAQAERKAMIASQLDVVVASGGRIAIPEGCGVSPGPLRETPAALDCTPVLSGPILSGRMNVQPAAGNGLLLTALIEEYGQGLVQIATAADVAAVKEAGGRANAAITALATTVGGPAIGAAAGAVGNAVQWIVGRYLDQQRFEELRAVVVRADPTIAAAADRLAAQADLMQRAVALRRVGELRARARELARLQAANDDRGKIDDKATALVDEAIAVQQFVNLDPAAPYRTMRAAHARLLDALSNPEVSPEAVFVAINELIAHAEAVQAALAKLGE